MPTANDFFPSKYLRCADLGGKERPATIKRVESEMFENDGERKQKPVIHFENPDIKPLVCNKTNFLTIAKFCGNDTTDWPGRRVLLYPDLVPFKGQVTEAVRVKRVLGDELNDSLPY